MLGALALAGSVVVSTAAQAEGLPRNLAWTAYDVGSSGYAQAVAIGAALKNNMGVTLRVLPGKNDVSRLVPLRDEKVQFSAFGVGAYQAIEAVDTFGTRDWGPQDLYLLGQSNPDSCTNLITAGDVGIKTVADYKGKRIAWVKGAPALNHNVFSILQFAGLTWDDVEKVEVGGNAAMFEGMIDGRIDAAFTVSTAGNAVRVFSGPRGAMWPVLPHDDAAGWARMQKAAPYYYKQICKEGAGISQPVESVSYPYPILIAYRGQDENMVYEMTKAMFELFPNYKDAAPGAAGWALDRQQMSWVLPWHPGAVRYYKEAGKWTPEAQANQEKVVARMKLIQDTWKSYAAKAPKEAEAFAKGWHEARVGALEKAGLDPVFRE
jgi:TRAP transporter TAXI family solute receptor